MFNDEITLVSYEVVPDELKNQKKKPVYKTILCDVESTTRNEFYNYGSAQLRPEYVATINACEYDDEVEAIFKGKEYKITRTFKNERDLMELTLSRSLQR